MDYILYNSGLAMETNFLTKEAAYFLGGIYASDENSLANGKKYKIAPVRYNYGFATDVQIVEHYDHVRDIASRVNGYTAMAENIRNTDLDSGKHRLPGFSTFFESEALDSLEDGIPSLKNAIEQSPWDVQRAFVTGMFDGRGTSDINKRNHALRYIVLDCPTNRIGGFLTEVLDMVGLDYNYNTARDRKEGGKPRKPQLRIKDGKKFMEKIGLISPKRFDVLMDSFNSMYNNVRMVEENEILPGLKTIEAR